jgi:hypothetical protein
MGIFDWLLGKKESEEINYNNFKIKIEKVDDDSNIVELQEFLNKMLEKYALRNKEVIHHYTINFDKENMIVSSSCYLPLSEELKKNPILAATLDKPMISKHTIPLQEVRKLYYKEHKSAEWLVVETKPGKIEYDNEKGKVKNTTETSFILKKEITKDNYLSLIIPAFHKIINAKFNDNHSLESVEHFHVN